MRQMRDSEAKYYISCFVAMLADPRLTLFAHERSTLTEPVVFFHPTPQDKP